MSLDDITLAVDYFDLKKIAESGQCFRWKELGPGKYLIPSGQTCAIVEQKEPGDDLHLLIEEGTLPLWQDYLNCGERYGSIVREAREATLADGSPDLFLREAALEAAGVQILTQDLWETLVSFVISQNNNIPRIKKLVAALCKQFGERRQLASHEFYTFPTWERLAGQDLSGLGLGYRDKYVEQLAQNVADYEMGRVVDNILDLNTKATAKRKITLTIELTPDDERQTISVAVQAKATLAPTNPVATALCITSDGNGEMVVAEMVPQIPGQMNMDGTQQEAPKILKLVQAAN